MKAIAKLQLSCESQSSYAGASSLYCETPVSRVRLSRNRSSSASQSGEGSEQVRAPSGDCSTGDCRLSAWRFATAFSACRRAVPMRDALVSGPCNTQKTTSGRQEVRGFEPFKPLAFLSWDGIRRHGPYAVFDAGTTATNSSFQCAQSHGKNASYISSVCHVFWRQRGLNSGPLNGSNSRCLDPSSRLARAAPGRNSMRGIRHPVVPAQRLRRCSLLLVAVEQCDTRI